MGPVIDVLAIDPGVHRFGWAAFQVTLIAAGLTDHGSRIPMLSPNPVPDSEVRASTVVVEMPQVDGRTRRVRLQDVLDLAFAAGVDARAHGPRIEVVHPRDWKGDTPKSVVHARVRGELSAAEREALDHDLGGVPRGVQHNVMDAVGIGLWWMRRSS